MVNSRVALGSVSTLAVAALILGAAPLVLKTWRPSSPTPWGAIASFSGNLSTSTPSDGDRSQLLKLAALKSGKADAPPEPAMTAAAQLATLPPPEPEVSAEPAPAVAPPTVADAAAAGSTTVEQAPVVMASADASAGVAGPQAAPLPPSRIVSTLININRATPDDLDHFPGTGRIGRAIVSHRPYHAIDDLVKRRVLRTSDFRKIQGRISVD